MQKYSFLFILITSMSAEKESREIIRKARGSSRSAKSLFIDVKVKIFACNVESFKADSKSV